MNNATIGLICQFALAVILGIALLVLAFVLCRRGAGGDVADNLDLLRVEQRVRNLCSRRSLLVILFIPYVACAALLYPWAAALNKTLTVGNWLWSAGWGLILVLFAMISAFYVWGRGAIGERPPADVE